MRARRLRRCRRGRRSRRRKALLSLGLAAGALSFVGASWLAGRGLARRLISARGLAPPREQPEELLAALGQAGGLTGNLRHPGSARDPVEMAAVFASPGDPSARPTILFLHGKGGSGAEWRPEALRALKLGYNVLLPDLRGHGASQGTFVTYGFLEREDLANAVAAAREEFGIDADRLGVHGCSAGATLAMEFAAERDGILALWVESPYAQPREMARHYLSLQTGLPSWLLGLTSRWAVGHAVAHVRRELSLEESDSGIELVDPLTAIGRVKAPICLVYGDTDRLVPPRFVERLEAALPPGSRVWRVSAAGHCHHDNEPSKVAKEEYDRKWTGFFSDHLPVKENL